MRASCDKQGRQPGRECWQKILKCLARKATASKASVNPGTTMKLWMQSMASIIWASSGMTKLGVSILAIFSTFISKFCK
jgi:hypothetical protein